MKRIIILINILLVVINKSLLLCNNLPRITFVGQTISIDLADDEAELELSVSTKPSGVTTSPITVRNKSSCFVDLMISAKPHHLFSFVTSTGVLTTDQARIYALFQPRYEIPKTKHFQFNDIVSTIPVLATTYNFKIDGSTHFYNGYNIPPDRDRYIYFRIDISTSTSLGESTTTFINIMFKAIPSKIENLKKEKEITKEGGRLELEDGSYIVIPQGAIDDKVIITIKSISPLSVPSFTGMIPLAVYEFLPQNLVFRKQVEMYLQYPECLVQQNNLDETKLAVYFYDGYQWRVLGGEVDKDKNYVKVKVSHFACFGIFAMQTITEDDVRPKEKIITPARRDGKNDFARFGIPYGQEFEINIYDISGRRVRRITQSSPCGSVWDGKDEVGNIVESGVYIYQVKTELNGEKKIISGPITVAK